MTAELQATAVLAAINTKLAALTIPWAAYDVDTIPTTTPATFVVVTVTRRFGDASRMPGRKSRTGYRITARAVSRTVTNARLATEKTRQALEDARLTVSSVVASPIQFETEAPIGPDDGWYSGLTSWTYTHGGNP